MTDLAHVDPAMMLESASDPGEFVVQCLERGKTWLAEALEHNDLEALTNMKGYAETLRVATMQKQLGKDAVLSATELVRRAERAIGLGVRRGQDAGEICGVGQSLGRPTTPNVVINHILTKDEWGANGAGVRHITDDVTDDEFEQAIEEAKAEGNLSRANLVRKVKPEKAKPKSTGRHEVHHKGRRIDAERIIEQTISTLEGLAMGLALIEDVPSLDAEKRLEWLEALRQPLKAINRLNKELRG